MSWLATNDGTNREIQTGPDLERGKYMSQINVIDHTDYVVLRERNPDEQYDGDDTLTTHDITGIKLASKNWGDVETSFDVLPYTDYYLLYYEYGTGDSFSFTDGNLEIVALYNDCELAEKSRAALDAAAKAKQSKAMIWDDSGKEYEEYLGCVTDYFGSYNGATVVTVRLN